MMEERFNLEWRKKSAELGLSGDSVLVVYYVGAHQEHSLAITSYGTKALEVANGQQGFPVALYKDGKRVMDEYYNGQTKLFHNGITYQDYEDYWKIPKSIR